MVALRDSNFHASGTRKTPAPDGSQEVLVKQIEYHNNAVYRIFEFFEKIALALLGGLAYLSQAPQMSPRTLVLVRAGGWLLLLSSALLSIGIFSHQKSKIRRWPRRFRWHEPLIWFELWLVQGMLLVAVGYLAWLLPRLTTAA